MATKANGHGGRRSGAGRPRIDLSEDDKAQVCETMRLLIVRAEKAGLSQAVKRHSRQHRWLVDERNHWLSKPPAEREAAKERFFKRRKGRLGDNWGAFLQVTPKQVYGISPELRQWAVARVKEKTGRRISFDTIKRVYQECEELLAHDPLVIAARLLDEQ